VNEAFGVAALAAVIVAAGISLALSRRIVAPLREMTSASRRIAEGKYDERVAVKSADELGQLGESFNQMAAQLEQVEAMRRQLIGDVSHELRTPLTAIKGSMEGLMDGVLPADAETYQQIHAEADRLSRLVDDLQELSRVEARAYQLDFRETDLSALVETTIKRLTPNARAKRISLTSSLPSHLPRLLADEDRLGQVFDVHQKGVMPVWGAQFAVGNGFARAEQRDRKQTHHVGVVLGGVEMLDAPVSGGEPEAVSGSLTIMAGGKPVFQCGSSRRLGCTTNIL
jgi:signal transduction histidine kinase